MLAAISIMGGVILVSLLAYNAYILWYVRSGRYELDRRFDSVTKP
jgi:hypothetical protein